MDMKKYAKAMEDLEAGRNLEEAIRIVYSTSITDEAQFQRILAMHKAEAERGKKSNVDIPGLGVMTKGGFVGEYCSKPIPVPVLGGKKCRITVEGYDDDPDKEAFLVAIANFLSLPESALKKSERYVFQYYKDLEDAWKSYDDDFKPIPSPADVWKHVRLGTAPTVSRRAHGDKGIYVSVECGCDWEEEHGLQIVFKNGLKVNKVGPFDGHLTNSDAYGDESLEDVIYQA